MILLIFIKQSGSLTDIRYHFDHINQNKLHVEKLKLLLEKDTHLISSIKQAYLASCIMGEANYLPNPLDKVKKFNTGKPLLELAVKSDSTSIEIRYIRYTIQMNVPTILNYKAHQKTDRLFLISNAHKVKINDTELYQKIILFLETKANLTEQELKKLKA